MRGGGRAASARRPFSSVLLEPEADAAHGGDVARGGGIVAELLTQPGDVHVQGLGGRPPGGVPDLAHQLLTGDDPARVPYQDAQQVELLGGELQLLVAHPRTVRLDVDAHTLGGGRVLGRATAQQGPDAGQQLGKPERLGDIVVGAQYAGHALMVVRPAWTATSPPVRPAPPHQTAGEREGFPMLLFLTDALPFRDPCLNRTLREKSAARWTGGESRDRCVYRAR